MRTLPSLFRLMAAAGLAVSVLTAGLTVAVPVAAEPVRVRAEPKNGYGQIIFNWQSPVGYQVAQNGDRLTVRFSRPIETSYVGISRRLGSYVRQVTAGEDGRSVSIQMRPGMTGNAFDVGQRIFVEVGPPEDSPAPATQAAEAETPASQPAAARPTVRVRAGEHTGYSRLVFDWPRRVPYRVTETGTAASITFDSPATLNLNAVRPGGLKNLNAITAQAGDGSVTARLTVPQGARLRHFQSGSKVVLDIRPADPKAPQQAKAPAQAQADSPPPAAAAPAKTASKPPAPAEQKTAAAPSSPSAPQAPAGAPKSLNKPVSLVPESERQAQAEAAGQPAGEAAPGDGTPATAPTTAVTSEPLGPSDTVGMRFDWSEPVAAAVFRRAGNLWLIFDKAATLDTDALKTAAGNAVRTIEQLPSDKASILRMTTVAGINPALKRDGLAWIIELKKGPLQPLTMIDSVAQPESPAGSRLFLSVPEPGNALALRDPEVGDNLIVIPVIPLGHGTPRLFEYPQFRVLRTGQGVVIEPRADGIRVKPLRQGIEVTSATGLQISKVSKIEAAAAADKGPLIKPLTKIFNLDKWAKADPNDFNKNKQRLQLAVAKAKGAAREKARMDLARFYFGHAFGAEAMGVLRMMAVDRKEVAEDPEYIAMRGVSQALMHHLAEAEADLNHESLQDNDEVAFWRAAVQVLEGHLADAAPELKRTGAVTRPYPKRLKIMTGLMVADAAIELGDFKQAEHFLTVLSLDEPDPTQKSQIDYVAGRFMELAGNFDTAIAKWEAVAEGPHRPSRAKAAVARTELLLKLRRMATEEAIVEMEKLRFSWRGDDFEFNLLRRLGDLYMKAGDFRSGLRTLRQAATNFRTHENASEVSQEMVDAFNSLYLEGEADALQPITAIALYDEFRELTPAGAEGDEMIRMLADRLVSVDLLDRGAKLLENQVKFRLQGAEKARVGAQLALVRIFDRKPEEALQALQDSEAPDLPEDLSLQRSHLMARALSDLNRKEEALVLLKKDKSLEATLLRTEFNWLEQNWAGAARELRKVVRLMEAKKNEPLDERQAKYVLDLAVAMTLSGNERGVAKLDQDFGKAIEGTALKDAFRLIVSGPVRGLTDPGTIAAKVKDITNFQSYMNDFREKLKESSLSSIN